MNNIEQNNGFDSMSRQGPPTFSAQDVDIIKRYFRRNFKVASPNFNVSLLVQHITLVSDMLLDNIFNRINMFPSSSIEIKKRFNSGKYFLDKVVISNIAYILALINIVNQILNQEPIFCSSVESFLTYTSIKQSEHSAIMAQYKSCVENASKYLNEQVIFNKKSNGSNYIAADNILDAVTAGNMEKENNANLPNLRFTVLTATLTVIAIWRNDKKLFDCLANALSSVEDIPPIGGLII